MVKKYRLIEERLVESTAEDSTVLVYVNPAEEDRRFLVEQLKIDEHTLISALDPDELARLEFEPTHTACILKRPTNYSGTDQLFFKANTMGVFYFGNRLIIVLADDINPFEGKPFIRVTSLSDILLKVIYRVIYHFLEHLKVVNMISDELEHKISKAMENKYLLNLFTLEKSLVYYLNAINSNSLLIERLRHHAEKIGFTGEQLEFLEDISVENGQCYRQAEIYSNILASLMDARVSIVSNNLNVLMKTLNIITIGIMVPTLVVSVFSMNVRIPMEDLEHAFWLIMGLAACSVAVFLMVWRRYGK
jgi:magnesium transporter